MKALKKFIRMGDYNKICDLIAVMAEAGATEPLIYTAIELMGYHPLAAEYYDESCFMEATLGKAFRMKSLKAARKYLAKVEIGNIQSGLYGRNKKRNAKDIAAWQKYAMRG